MFWVAKMDLKKKVELYFGQSQVRGDTPEMQRCLDAETEFCALYGGSDVPADVHNGTNDLMLSKFGVHSDFAKKGSGYVRPFQVDTQTGFATVGIIDANASSLRGTRFKVGGTFFDGNIAEAVIAEFQKSGYEVVRKYK